MNSTLFSHFVAALLCLGIGAQTLQLTAQQQALLFTSAWDQTLTNPAAAGHEPVIGITGQYRNQWAGVTGHPTSQSLMATMPVFALAGGAGLHLHHSSRGAQTLSMVRASFARKLKVPHGKLQIGLAVGVVQGRLDGRILRTPDGQYGGGNISHADPILSEGMSAGLAPDLGFAVWWELNRLTVGMNAAHLNAPKLSIDGGADHSWRFSRNLSLRVAKWFVLSPSMELQPMIFVQSDLQFMYLESGVTAMWNDRWFGTVALRGYNARTADAIIAGAGMKLDRWQFGYAYDVVVSSLSRASSGSHELMVRYEIPVKVPSRGKIINNPRFIAY